MSLVYVKVYCVSCSTYCSDCNRCLSELCWWRL